METISISKFKATCLAVIARVKKTGEPMLIIRRGEPMAQLVPPPPAERRASWLGMFRDTGEITGDIVPPISEDVDWEVLAE